MSENLNPPKEPRSGGCNRGDFLAGATAVGLTILGPELVAGSQANAKISVALIGCGGRGSRCRREPAAVEGFSGIRFSDRNP